VESGCLDLTTHPSRGPSSVQPLRGVSAVKPNDARLSRTIGVRGRLSFTRIPPPP
jgi:hypothetical protein